MSTRRLVLGIVWVVSAIYLFHGRNTIFFPLDEGLLAQSAERVLNGQLPHRDFVDVYTGVLSALDAAAFAIWGRNLMAIRNLLCLAAVLWVPVLYGIALRVASPWAAGLAVLAAVAWSVPYYPLGMPSWYVLFLASAGTLALLKFMETHRRRWLLAAGIAAGAACTIKITGLYFIAAALLTLVYIEQDADRSDEPTHARRSVYAWLVVSAAAAYVTAVAVLVRSQGADAFVAYVVPNAAIAGLVIWRERADAHVGTARRMAALGQWTGWFLAGVVVPIALLLIPYVRAGAVGALLTGVFVTPMKRLSIWYAPPFPIVTTLAAVPVAVALGMFRRSARTRWLLALAAAVVLVASGAVQPYAEAAARTPLAVTSRLVRDALHGLVPVVAIAGAILLGTRRAAPAAAVPIFALATGWLVMFPMSQDVYFHYVTPLLALALLAVAQAGWGSAVVGGFFLAYAVAQHSIGIMAPASHMVRLDLPRGGPLVTPQTNAMYVRLVSLIGAHAHGRYIYATPDSPDVYFLSGYLNPTSTMYEAFDPPTDRARTIPPLLDASGVTVVVIARQRYVSGPVDPGLAAALDRQFPHADTAGWYVVRWR
jgi:hypothetical protein